MKKKIVNAKKKMRIINVKREDLQVGDFVFSFDDANIYIIKSLEKPECQCLNCKIQGIYVYYPKNNLGDRHKYFYISELTLIKKIIRMC